MRTNSPNLPRLEGTTSVAGGRTAWGYLLLWTAIGFLAFHLAYAVPQASILGLAYLFALLQLALTQTWRQAFYSGLAVGVVIAATRLDFFWRIFSGGAIALWLVYALWLGLFVSLARLCLTSDLWQRLPARLQSPTRLWAWGVLPFLWCGLEYFRSELYYLRFAWLTPGFAFGFDPSCAPFRQLGTYGIGFVLMSLAGAGACLWQRSKLQGILLLLVGAGMIVAWGRLVGGNSGGAPTGTLRVAGVQLEFPSENEVLVRLNDLVKQHPEAELLVLSEYTFDRPVPQRLRQWCRKQGRFVIVGGKDEIPGSFYNTAFVISTNGETVFRQAKSVPIQFFKDGLPAPDQHVWASPWGQIGICICYDLSYSRVTDRLVRQGAQALIVPTMDVMDWGERQHWLHARVAPIRAAEYGIPVFRLASSGISQLANDRGHVETMAPCPGDGATISGVLRLGRPGALPVDRWLAPISTAVTGLVVAGLLFLALSKPQPLPR